MTIEENLRKKGTVKKGSAEASVLVGGTRYDLSVSRGTLGPDAVDISTLYQDTGRFTYDLVSPLRQAASRGLRSSISTRE